VPTLLVADNAPICIVRLSHIDPDRAAPIFDCFAAREVRLDVALHTRPEYPVASVKLTLPTRAGEFHLEAVPDIADPDVRDCLDRLLSGDPLQTMLFVGDPPELFAETHVDAPAGLRETLGRAAEHFFAIPPERRDYRAAGQAYLESTSL